MYTLLPRLGIRLKMSRSRYTQADPDQDPTAVGSYTRSRYTQADP